MAAFYFIALLAIIFAGWIVLEIAFYPIYKLLGGGDNFIMYLQYIFRGPKA